MIFFKELWGYVSGLLISGVSLSPKSFAFRKLKFKSLRAVSWLIQAIQAVTNATSVSTSQPWRVRYYDQLPSLESSLSVEAQSNIAQIAGYVKYFQKNKRIPIGTTKSMASLLQFSVVEVWFSQIRSGCWQIPSWAVSGSHLLHYGGKKQCKKWSLRIIGRTFDFYFFFFSQGLFVRLG